MAMPAEQPPDDFVIEARAAIAADVRSLMGRHRVSQTRLAAVLHLSQPALSRRLKEAPEVPFSFDELVQIARYFDTTVSELVATHSGYDGALSLVSAVAGQGEFHFDPAPELVLLDPVSA